ncbi:butyrophilin subfamily 1 member A1 [Grus japonensis]|uniref:Butyrophilin subfamily 1 member A1 n=1 Tax=Grus japonensis TaxID=30415 RepID=A0ABC9XYJ8_GRUJA
MPVRRNLCVSVSFSITKLTSEWWDQTTLSVSPWGRYVVLPCHLSPSVDARSLDIRWIRHHVSETVHHYRNGEDLYGDQMEEYVGRTELVRDGLSRGRLDLRISGLRPSDDGQYVCTVRDGASYGEATVDLEVAATGSGPQLSLEAYEDGGIRVVCRSAGWYPQPEVLWKDPDGEHLPSVSQRHSSDERGLFDVKDVIIVTNGNRDGKWSCVVRSIRLNQEQETSLHISAPFFHNARPWMVGVGVLLVLSAGAPWPRCLSVEKESAAVPRAGEKRCSTGCNPPIALPLPPFSSLFSSSRRRCGSPRAPGGLLSYLVTLHVLRLGSADFRVVGPDRPLQVTVGQDVVLPCHLSPSMDAQSLDIRWIRHQVSETVHHYRNGEDLYGEQMEEYVGRTELVRDGLSSGRLDLRISGLRPSDDGQYVCTVTDGASYGEATVDLEVAATGSVPQLSLEAYEDGGIRVVCRSAGWYPQPEVLWKDPDGQRLPSVSQRLFLDSRGLYDIEGIIVVSNGNRHGKWSCVVRNSRLNQEQETSLHISAPFFHNARPWMVGVGVLLVVLVVFLGLGVYFLRRKVLQSRELGRLVAALATAFMEWLSLQGAGWQQAQRESAAWAELGPTI